MTDLFGFGYLLPSLLAVKMLQKKTVGRILLPALETSLLAFVLANFIGMGLDLLEPPRFTDDGRNTSDSSSTQMLARTPMGAALTARTRARLDVARQEPLERSRSQLIRYRELWRKVGMALVDGPDQLRDLQADADYIGLELRELHDRGDTPAYLLLEKEESLRKQVGWDTAILFPGRLGPVLAVPRPHSEDYAAVAATYICHKIRCRAILISGVDTVRAGVPEGDALANDRTSYHYAHEGLGRTQIVQLRVFGDSDRDDADADRAAGDAMAHRAKPTLHIKGRLSSHLDLDALWPVPVDITWERPPDSNVQWEQRADLAVFRIPRADMEEQLFLCARAVQTLDGGDLGPWLAERFDALEIDNERQSPEGEPCGWLPIEEADAAYDDLMSSYDPPDDSAGDSADDSRADSTDRDSLGDERGFADLERNPIIPDLLAQGASVPGQLRELIQPFTVPHTESLCSASTNLGEWVGRTLLQDDVVPLSSSPLSETELTFMREHLLIPLLDDIRENSLSSQRHIYWLSKLAYQVGYEIVLVEDCDADGTRCWLLSQHPDSTIESSVLALIREGDTEPMAIEVPKPDLEPGTWRLGLELWRDTRARMLLMGVPITERFPQRARTLRDTRSHMFHTLHKAVDRSLTDESGSQRLILQVRGYGSWRQLADDLVIGIGRPLLTWFETSADASAASSETAGSARDSLDGSRESILSADMPPMLRALLLQRQSSGLHGYGSVRLADGEEEIIELRGRRNRELSYSRVVGQTDMAMLWFSQNARLKYRRFSNPHQCRMLDRAGLSPVAENAHRDAPRSFFLNPPLDPPATVHEGIEALPKRVADIVDLTRRAAAFENHNLLMKLTHLARTDDDLQVAAGTDAEFGRPFLIATLPVKGQVYRVVVLLGEFLEEAMVIPAGSKDSSSEIDNALSRRASPIIVYGRVRPGAAPSHDPEVTP